MKPLTKDEIVHILKRTPRPDVIGFIWPSENQTGIQLKYDTLMFKRGNWFKDEVVEFLSSASLTKTIVDIRHRFIDFSCEVEVWLSNSVLETNIDWDVIEAFLKNIGHHGNK